ncbi:hypothetical protein LP414_13380 [Polaromonas sp. P1(28)-13]|nr:hypothetical protein LP414_13380 [Polaromonas sp. P1(28)-13]
MPFAARLWGRTSAPAPDYATNDLGTCKHIEFTLAKLQAKRGGKAALARGLQPAYSEIWLDYAGARHVRFRDGADCPPALLTQAKSLFDAGAGWALRWNQQGGLERLIQSAQDSGARAALPR